MVSSSISAIRASSRPPRPGRPARRRAPGRAPPGPGPGCRRGRPGGAPRSRIRRPARPGRRARAGRRGHGASGRAAPRAATRRPAPRAPTSSIASRTSYGGASGSGPPCHAPYRNRCRARSGSVDRARRRRLLVDAAGSGAAPPARTRRAAATSPGRRVVAVPEPVEHLGQARHGADLAEQLLGRRPARRSRRSPPSAKSSVKPDRSSPASRARNVSAVASRSRWCEDLDLAALLADLELHLAAQGAGPRSARRRSGPPPRPRRSRPLRRSAEAATVSAAAIANRARDTRTLVDRRATRARPRANRASTSSRCSGTVGHQRGLLADQGDLRPRGRAGSGCGSRRRTGP